MVLGYNTNGLAFHRLADAIDLIADAGYGSVALTLDHHHLDPTHRGRALHQAAGVRAHLHRRGLRVTVETGARFILDPRRKHQPTLISAAEADRARRLAFLKTAVDVAAALNADSLSLWSGAADDDAGGEELRRRLAASLAELLAAARPAGVRLAFEPEPGMFIDTMDRFAALFRDLDDPLLGLTLDVGHVHCLGDGDAGGHVRAWRDRLWNIHAADCRRGVHEHLMFGEGEMDFAPIFAALADIRYEGPFHVELSRHSHVGVEALHRAHAFLARYF